MKLNNNYIVIKANKKISCFDLKKYGFITVADKTYKQKYYTSLSDTLRKCYKTWSNYKENAFNLCERIKNVLVNNKNIQVISYGIASAGVQYFSYAINFKINNLDYTIFITRSNNYLISTKENILYLLNNTRYVKKENEFIFN